jgi:hypothetical protein
MKAVQGERGTLTLEAVRRLTALYQSWGKAAEAARYQLALSSSTQSQPATHTP